MRRWRPVTRGRFSILVVFVMVLTSVALVPAGATPPMEVELQNGPNSEGDPAGFGLFTARGPAVEEGLICPAGHAVNDALFGAGPPWNYWKTVHVVRTFYCDDESGTFTVRLQGLLFTPFHWVILSGTGDYEGLHGAGQGWVQYHGDGTHTDWYTSGGLHIDP